MPKTRAQKEEIVRTVAEALKTAPGTVFVIQDKLTVNDVSMLRKELYSQGVELMAVKKTLLKIALKDAGLSIPVDEWQRTVAVAFSANDALAPARLLHAFAKTRAEQVTLIGGVLEGVFVDAAQVKELATLPSREELLAKTVYVLKAPVSGFANVLAGNLRGLVYAVKAISEQKSS